MIVISNPLAYPVVLAAWSIDAWLWCACIAAILKRLNPGSQLSTALDKLVSPVISATSHFVTRLLKRNLPEWSLWLITFTALIIIRHVLVSLIVSS